MDKNKESNRDFWGYTCIVVGVLFCCCAIGFFFYGNHMNFKTNKTEATILTRSEIETTEGEKKTLLQVSYKVGSELVVTSYQYGGEPLEEEDIIIDVRYRIDDPDFIVDSEWTFEAVYVFVLGLVIVLGGMCIKGFILKDMNLFAEEPGKGASKREKEIFESRKVVINNLFPFAAAVLFAGFGVVLAIMGYSWWVWLFVAAGGVGMLYFGLELFPAAIEWKRLTSLNNMKVKVTDTEVDVKKTDNKNT